MVAPPAQVSRQVAQFLSANGCTQVTNRRDMIKVHSLLLKLAIFFLTLIQVTASVSVIEKLLQTTLYNFQHVDSMHFSTFFPICTFVIM